MAAILAMDFILSPEGLGVEGRGEVVGNIGDMVTVWVVGRLVMEGVVVGALAGREGVMSFGRTVSSGREVMVVALSSTSEDLSAELFGRSISMSSRCFVSLFAPVHSTSIPSFRSFRLFLPMRGFLSPLCLNVLLLLRFSMSVSP